MAVKTRTAARLAWSLCAGCIAGICGLVVLKVLNGATDLRSMPLVAAPLAFSVVGALVASRQQRNPVGWQLLAVGVFMTANLAGESYARYALLSAPGLLPGGLYGAWLGWSTRPSWRSWRSSAAVFPDWPAAVATMATGALAGCGVPGLGRGR